MTRLATFLIIAAILSSALVSGPLVLAQGSQTSEASNRPTPAQAKSIIASRAREVIVAIKNRDMQRLSTFVHPTKGLRFSQFGYVLPESDRLFSRREVASLFRSNRRYRWGTYDESEKPIYLSARQYFNKFVYRQDMLRAKEVKYNTQIKPGNTIPNVLEAYPRAITVAYFHTGSDPRYDGMDWEVLWLAFEKKDKNWYLVAIVTDEWTI